jgi:hypothetical protein
MKIKHRLILVGIVLPAVVVGCLVIAMMVRRLPLTPEQEAAARAEAQAKWLDLVQQGAAYEDHKNALPTLKTVSL